MKFGGNPEGKYQSDNSLKTCKRGLVLQKSEIKDNIASLFACEN